MRIVVLAVEPSADLHGGALVRALKAQGDVEVMGLGGAHLKEAGMEIWEDVTDSSEMGVTSPMALVHWANRIGRTRKQIQELKPDVVIGIDSPDFNMRVVKGLKGSIRTVQYVAPQAWAWRPGRRETVGRLYDQVLCIWPFEVDFFKDCGAEITWVGVPVLDHLNDDLARQQPPEIPSGRRPVCLLPGSRPKEIRLNLPNLVEAAWRLFMEHDDLIFVLPRAPSLDPMLFECTRPFKDDLVMTAGGSLAAMNSCEIALAVNGTVTIEAMFLGIPHVSTYAATRMMKTLYGPFIKSEYFHMANILSGREVVPELMGDRATADNITVAASLLLAGEGAEEQKNAFAKLREDLGGPGAAERAAKAVLSGMQVPHG